MSKTDKCKERQYTIKEKNISPVQVIKQPKLTKNQAKTSRCDVWGRVLFKKKTVFFFLRIRFAWSVAMLVTKAPTICTNRKERGNNFKQKSMLFYPRAKWKMAKKENMYTQK